MRDLPGIVGAADKNKLDENMTPFQNLPIAICCLLFALQIVRVEDLRRAFSAVYS